MKVKRNKISALKPVHPRSVRHHGLFGLAYVRQHMVIDKQWSPDSLTKQFEKMSQLLHKHAQFIHLEKKVQHTRSTKTSYALQKQIRDGRSNLKLLRSGSHKEVRNILKENPPMQRLYQKMPLHLAVENINQRTFGMRKERDRLECRLHQLENILHNKLIESADLENRIKYENEFKLEEETKMVNLNKELVNSRITLQANMTINSTYKKIIQILQQDEIFYLPILRSLDEDVKDQSRFIKHILHLGSPAIERFQELNDQYKTLQDKARRASRENIAQYTKYQNMIPVPRQRATKSSQQDIYVKVSRYVRETRGMRDLKAKFEQVEETIRKIKIATICGSEKDIYKRIKSQINNNSKLAANIENDALGHAMLQYQMKSAAVLQGVIVNNMTESETKRLEKIESLKEAIKAQDQLQETTLKNIKNHANMFVLVRMSLWNLHEILKHVGARNIPRPEYPVDYLKLPLLNYEMLTMKAFSPDAFEQNIMKLLKDVRSKIKRLTIAFDWKLSKSSIDEHKKAYCEDMMAHETDMDILSADIQDQVGVQTETNLIDDVKLYKEIPNRNDIKIASARLVEEVMKKDD